MVGLIHQGTPWKATGPAALVVAGMMVDERVAHGTPPVRPTSLHFWSALQTLRRHQAPLILRNVRDESKAVEF
jgi:hypothetical protein